MSNDIEKEFNKIQGCFNEGKKYLIGKNKNVKLSVSSYETYYIKLNNLYNNLKNKLKENEIESLNKIYINHLIKLSKIYLLIPYFFKSKTCCEKVLEIDKNNIEILPTYIKCLHHFKEYSLITNILNNITKENDIIKDLKIKNEERNKQLKGIYNLKNIYENFKKTNNYNLDLAEYKSNKISIIQDKIKGLELVANENISKGEILIAEKAIVYAPLLDKNLKYQLFNKEWHGIIKDKLKDKISYLKEDNPEIYEIYDGTNGNLSLEERKKNYSKNITFSEKQMTVFLTDSFCSKLFIYDELSCVAGLFYYSSFISHSCDPNISILGIGNFIFAIAGKNIQKNEELTTFYIENDKEFVKRQGDLYLHYGFSCQCSLCKIEKANFDSNFEVKNQISAYIKQLIDMSVNMFNYSLFEHSTKNQEVTLFIERNKDFIKNFEKGLLYYNLYYLWKDSKTNYNMLEKALDCFEKETSLNFNNMIYYCLLKMYKMSYVFNNKLCEDIREKMLKLFKEAFGNIQNEFAETIVNDIIKLNTSENDPDLNLFREKKYSESLESFDYYY